jgi:hypothetical protein
MSLLLRFPSSCCQHLDLGSRSMYSGFMFAPVTSLALSITNQSPCFLEGCPIGLVVLVYLQCAAVATQADMRNTEELEKIFDANRY